MILDNPTAPGPGHIYKKLTEVGPIPCAGIEPSTQQTSYGAKAGARLLRQ